MTKKTKEGYIDVKPLYEGDKTLQIKISNPSFKGGLPIEVDVELYNRGDDKYDCLIGHFGYNFYFRTNKGMKAEKYKTFPTLLNAIKRTCKTNDFEFVDYRII